MEPKTEKQKKFENDVLSQGISLSLNLEQNFKLYSYRIIDTPTFIERIATLTHDYKMTVEKLNKEKNGK